MKNEILKFDENKDEITKEKAIEALMKDREDRMRLFNEELQVLLAKYKVTLNIQQAIQVVPTE